MSNKKIIKILKIFVLILIFILIIYEGQKEIKAIDFAQTIILLRSFPTITLILFFLMGMVSVSIITLYDFIIIKHLKIEIKPLTIFNISFVASTINNVSGLGGLTGASIRAVFFKNKSNNEEDIINYSLLLVPATGIGLSVMTILTIINYKYIKPIIQQNKWFSIIILGFLIYLILYFFIDQIYYYLKKKPYKDIASQRFIVKIKLLLVSFLEWFFAFLFFTFITRQFNSNIYIINILGIFTLASIAGVASMLPGGTGSFDLVILLGFQYYGIAIENALAILILYRIFYYFIPLAIGIIFTLLLQFQNNNNIFKLKEFINQTSSITNILLRILVFLSGVVLLVSALIPGIADRIKFAVKLLSFPILQWSHQLSICIGILLIIMSIEIGMKVKRAYNITLYLLFLGAIFTFLKGFDYEEAIFICLVLLLLYMSKNSFYRKSLPFNWLKILINLIIAFIGIIIYVKLKHLILMDFLNKYNFISIFNKGTLKTSYSGIIAYLSLIVFLVIWKLTKPRIEDDNRYEEFDDNKLKDFLKSYDGHYLTHLIYLKDKHIFWAASNQVAIVYEKSHNVIVVLGDPIGNTRYFSDGIFEFHKFIDEYGYKSAFYQVSESLLPIYHDHGYNFFKLGETALVDLKKFDLLGPKYRDFRNILSRFQRDGYTFELYHSLSNEMYESIKEISDEWLEGRKEMGFSLGWFEKTYLQYSPIAAVKKVESGELIAFASIMPSYNQNQSASIDLMRFKKNAPNNTMTYLILNILLNYKENGYSIFNLGMAPLANVGKSKMAHFRERIAHLFTRYGKHFYSFDGLRNYKDKFEPKWEARYLAYEDISLLPSSLIEATLLIHSKKVGK